MRADRFSWVIVAVGALMGCIGMGSMFSLAVFLDPIATETGWSRAGISASMTIAFLAMGVGAFGWGWVSDRHGPRIVGIAGGLMLGTGLVLASRATSLLAFQLTYGLFLGVGGRRLLRAHDGDGQRLVRPPSRARRLPRLRRARHGAGDRRALRAMAALRA